MNTTKKFNKVIFPRASQTTADEITNKARKVLRDMIDMIENPALVITPAMVKREAIRNAIASSDIPRHVKYYDLRTNYGREIFKQVSAYQSKYRKEIAGMVELHRARTKRNKKVAAMEYAWKKNVLSNSIYQDYKKCLAENKFSHLRVRYNMLSIDRRNHLATEPIDYKVLAILKHRKVDNVDEPWY